MEKSVEELEKDIMNDAEPGKPKNVFLYYLLSAIFISVCIFELYALFRWSQGTVLETVSVLFAVIGLYGLGIGFFSSNKSLSKWDGTLDELTNPCPLHFFAGNCVFLTFFTSIMRIGLGSKMSSDIDKASVTLWLPGSIIWLFIGMISFVYVFFHILVVVPLTYFPMVISSAIVGKLRYSADDSVISMGARQVNIKTIINENHPSKVKGYVMGIPSLIISFLSQAYLLIS